MINEVDNILKGRVESTVEFETYKKTIGISQVNLIPNENGIAPLSKQNAFISNVKEEVNALETLDFSPNQETSNVNDIDIPILDSNVNEVKPIEQEPMFTSTLKEPEFNDVSSISPIEVSNPNELNGLSITATSEIVEKPQVVEEVKEDNGILDIQMPQMPDTIVGLEPKGVDEDLFEAQGTNNQTFESTNNDTINGNINLNSNQNIDSIIDEKNKKFIEEITNKINEHFNEIKELYKNSLNENNDLKQSVNEEPSLEDNENHLMNDALAQINNMVIPEQSTGFTL